MRRWRRRDSPDVCADDAAGNGGAGAVLDTQMNHSHVPHDEADEEDVIDDVAVVCLAIVGMLALLLAPIGVLLLTYLAVTQ
jgi:hypothetical protein